MILEDLFFTSYDEYNKNNEFQIKDCDHFYNYKIIKVNNLKAYDFDEMCHNIWDIEFAIQVVNLLNKAQNT